MKNSINVCREMGDKVPADVQIEFSVSHGGAYYLTTDLELKGRGIRQSGDGSDHRLGKKTYHVTEKAMEKLDSQYKCAYMELL